MISGLKRNNNNALILFPPQTDYKIFLVVTDTDTGHVSAAFPVGSRKTNSALQL